MDAALASPDDVDPAEVRRVVLRAIARTPEDSFTIERLATTHGLPAISVHAALVSLTAAGLVMADGEECVSTLQLDRASANGAFDTASRDVRRMETRPRSCT